MIEAGVAALKIEGRYKDAEYVALTTRAYRKAVDEAWAGRETLHLGRRETATGAGLFARTRPVFSYRNQSSGGGEWPCASSSWCADGTRCIGGIGSRVIETSEAHRIAPLKAAMALCLMRPIGAVPESRKKAGVFTRSEHRATDAWNCSLETAR